MTNMPNNLDICKADTAEADPDYLAIHSATSVQIARWDDWALQAAEMLERHGWKRRLIGTGLHMQHPFFLGGEA